MVMSMMDSECGKKSWMAAGAIAVVLFLALWAFAGTGFLASLVFGFIIFVTAGFLVHAVLCSGEEQPLAVPARVAPGAAAGAKPGPAQPAAVARTSASSGSLAEPAARAPEPRPAPQEAAKAEPGPAPQQAAPAGGEGVRPALLSAPRPGGADDLKRIRGIGPGLEKELNAAGVYHLDQIAGWSAEEVVWADRHLVRFKGRVSRDDWVGQARALCAGGSS